MSRWPTSLTGWLRRRHRRQRHVVRDALRPLRRADLLRTDWQLSVPLTVSCLDDTEPGSELDQVMAADPSSPRFLGLASPAAVVHVLELAGVLQHVQGCGYNPRVAIETGHPLGDRLQLLDDAFANPLCEIRLRRLRRPIPAALRGIEPPNAIDLLGVEWLTLQHPRRQFTAERPPLPGQEHPGLGLGGTVAELLRSAARRLGADGVLNHPRYYHNAEVYSCRFRYLDPLHEGWLAAVRRDLGERTLAERSWIIEQGRLRASTATDAVSFWDGEQVMPTVKRLANGFAAERYRSAVEEAAAAIHFTVAD
jgi:hypothetical protein